MTEVKKRIRWTQEELGLLKEVYPISNKEELTVLFPNRTIESVISKAEKMKLRKMWRTNIETTVKEKVVDCGYTLVNIYRDEKSRIRLIAICPEGHEIDCDYSNFKRGNGSCNDCKGAKIGEKLRMPVEEVESVVNSHGFYIVEGKDSYTNRMSRITIRCEERHLTNISFADFDKRKNKCLECIEYFIDIDIVKREFNKRGYTLVSKEYKSSSENLTYACPKHPEEYLHISWNNFQSGKGCRHCSFETTANLRRTPFEQVKRDFINKSYIIICEPEEYINERQDIQYVCGKHKELGVQTTSYEKVKWQNNSCKKCIEENMFKGFSHPNWKGGISSLAENLRRIIVEWKKDSMKNSNYKCVVSGEKFDVIHHLYSFNKIVDETLTLLNLDLREEISEYSEEEIRLIQVSCIQLHSKYGLGICLSHEIHNLFHREYGRHDNTSEQFYEFEERYKNGEFNKVI